MYFKKKHERINDVFVRVNIKFTAIRSINALVERGRKKHAQLFGQKLSFEGENGLNLVTINLVKILGIINQIFNPSLISSHITIYVYRTISKSKLP
jgi:hypothetical protein